MNAQEQLELFRNHVREALPGIPGARWYAVDDETSLDALATAGIAWTEAQVERGERFTVTAFKEFMCEIVAAVKSLRQQKPSDAPPLPEIWKDPVTGATAQNPWSGAEPDLESQGVITQRDPELAAYLKATANGVSYKFLAEQRDKEAKRARLAAIKYSEAEHRTNPFRTNDLQAQGQLSRENPELAEFYKREVEPVRLPWQPGIKNLTSLGRLMAQNPHLAKIVNRAVELQRQRIAEQKEAAQRAKAEAEATLQAADKLLQAK